MDAVSISKPEHSIEDGWHIASASVTIDGKTYQLKYKVSEGPIATGSEPFLAAALLLAMRAGQPLQIPCTVSPKLLTATKTIQDIFNKWFPEFLKIPLLAEPGLSDEEDWTAGVGAFFSGGVDSFYTLLKHQYEITKIILVHGFDMKLEKTSLRSKVSKKIRQIAQELGKPLIEVETNVRQLSDQYTVFQNHYAGSMLASVGLLLSPQFRKIYIPATYSYEHLFPECTHPLLDPLWSTESLTFEHNGCEANRIEKIARISQSDIAMKSLRVCFNNRDNSYNCGRCEKCLSTMVALQAVGALERCITFNQKLDIEAVSHMEISNYRLLLFVEENLKAIENNGTDPELAEALHHCINNYKYDQLSTQLNENLNEFLTSNQGPKFVSVKKNTILKSLWQVDSGWLLREVFKEKLKELDQKLLFGMLRRLHNNAEQ
jgi:hypothetical protein